MGKPKFKSQFDKRPVRGGIFPCDRLLPGDGLDPRYDRNEHNHKVVNRKALQLCAQVKDILNLALSACGDEVLHDAYVDSVIPAPDSTQLLVTVCTKREKAIVQEHLQRANGLLRTEVAMCITRKRVPNLRYEVSAWETE